MDSQSFYSSAAYLLTKSGSFIVDVNQHGHRPDIIANGHRSKSPPADKINNSNFNQEETTFSDTETLDGTVSSQDRQKSESLYGSKKISCANGYYHQDVERNIENKDKIKTEKDTKKAKLKFSEMPSRSKYTFVMLAVANFGAGCGFSLPAPFFPREAQKKGASPTEVGLVFSSFQLINFVAAPLFGNFLTKLGAKFVYTSGIMVAGTTAVLFGFLDQGPSGTVFVVMSFLVRSVEALGVSAFATASFAIISNEFPDHIASVFATLETCIGVGLMVGPTIGGALYEVGGFGLPFWVVGAIIVGSGLTIFTCLPVPKDNSPQRKGTVLSLLRSSMVWVTMLCIMVGSCGLGFLDPTLSNHLEQFDLSTLYVGLFFVIVPAIYAVLAPIWGYLSDTKDIQAPLLIGGSLLCAVGFMFVGPTPLLPFLPRELWTVIVGLVFYGLSVGCAIVPTMKCLVIGARDLGLPDSLDTFGLVSGLFNSIFCLGAFVGPTIGGALVDQIGFYYGSSIVAGLYLIAMVVSFVYFGLRRLRKNRSMHPGADSSSSKPSHELSSSEKTPLLCSGRS